MGTSRVRLRLWPEPYAVARLRAVPDLAGLADRSSSPVCIVVGHDEISAIVPESRLDSISASVDSASRGWRALTLDVVMKHDVIGVLAALGEALARTGVPVMVFSSHDTDHLLVPGDRLGRALAALNQVDLERLLR